MKIRILLLSLLFIAGQLSAQQKDQAEKVKSLMTSYHFSQAIDLAGMILAADSSRMDILMFKGKSQLALFRYQQALETFGNVLEKDSADTRVLFEISEVYRQLGETENAIKTCHKITELEPDNPYFSLQLASLYLQNEDYKSALAVLHTLYLIDSADFYVLKQIAGCYNEMKSADSAMIFYREALKLKPFDPGVTMKLANILIRKKDFLSALQNDLPAHLKQATSRNFCISITGFHFINRTSTIQRLPCSEMLLPQTQPMPKFVFILGFPISGPFRFLILV